MIDYSKTSINLSCVQSKVELTTIAQVYLGKKYHYVFQVLLYLALQAVNVANIILAAQVYTKSLL